VFRPEFGGGTPGFYRMKKYFFIFILAGCVHVHFIHAQPTAGTTGLLNTPTAEMQRDGTFMAGTTWLPKAMMPQEWNYHTWNYYLNITFLPFLEVNYRCTLLKIQSTGKYNQDRSVSMRCRLLQEQRYVPSLVTGVNDLYTSSKNGNQYFGAAYAVTTKTGSIGRSILKLSAGYGFAAFENSEMTGLFGGLSFSPGCLKIVEFIMEYDSKVFNPGCSVILFDHLRFMLFAYDLKYYAGGLTYKIYL